MRFLDFVDRRQAIALVEHLCRYDSRQPVGPLPIVAFLAPGGSGKTTLLDLIALRCENVIPMAQVRKDDFTDLDGYTRLLVEVRDQLRRFSSLHYRRLAFPRFDLGVSIVGAELSPDNPGAVRDGVRRILNSRQHLVALLKELTGVSDNWFINFPLVFMRRALSGGAERDRGGRRGAGDVLGWYRRHTADLSLTNSAEVVDVLVRTHEWSRPGSAVHQRATVERLLLGAFLADLEHAYDRTLYSAARDRTTLPLLLIDDFDRLPDAAAGERLLRDLAGFRASGQHDPLLVIVTSAHRLFDIRSPAQHPPFEERDDTMTAVSTAEYSRDIHATWRAAERGLPEPEKRIPGSADRYLLPFWLPDLSLVDSSAYLAGRLRPHGRLQHDDLAVLAAIHQRTNGHPLALSLTADAATTANPSGTWTPEATETLLRSLLSTDAEGEHADWIEVVAAPRRISVAVLQALFDVDEITARQRWESLLGRAFTRFVDAGSGAEAVLHPLLRRLLLERLRLRPEIHNEAQTRLVRHFTAAAREGDEAALVECVYHWLTIGTLPPAVAAVATAIGERDSILGRLLTAASEAHTGNLPPDAFELVSEALHVARSTGRLQSVAAALVLSSWRQNEPGLNTEERTDLAYDLAEAHRQLRKVWPEGSSNPETLFAEAASVRLQDVPAVLTPAAMTREPPITSPFTVHQASRRGRYLLRAALVLVLLVPVISYTTLYLGPARGLCNRPSFLSVVATTAETLANDHISVQRSADSECIGISDGNYAFDQDTNEAAGALKARAAVSRVHRDTSAATDLWRRASVADSGDAETLIYLENEHVATLSKKEKMPYVTVVVLTALTANSKSRTEVGGGRDELQGVYVAQRDHNDEFRIPLIRVLIANAGGNYRYAVPVARQIIEAAHDDSTIVAVTGLSESRAETIAAIHVLAAARIPMISSTASSDSLSGISSYFFRVAPSNNRQVDMGVRYAVEQLKVRRAVLFEAINDNYSESLAIDFRRQFVGEYHGEILETETFDASDPDISNVILEKAGHACSFKPDMIYFTGRSAQMIRLLNSMNPCADNTVRLFGADELYTLLAPPSSGYPPYAYNRLYFTAFAFPTMWKDGGLAEVTPSFYREYPELFDPDSRHRTKPVYGYSQANGHVVLAFDAMTVMLNSIINAVRETGSTRFSPDALRRSLSEVHGDRAVQGASGLIKFGADNDPIDKVIVMLRVDDHGNTALVPGGLLGSLRK